MLKRSVVKPEHVLNQRIASHLHLLFLSLLTYPRIGACKAGWSLDKPTQSGIGTARHPPRTLGVLQASADSPVDVSLPSRASGVVSLFCHRMGGLELDPDAQQRASRVRRRTGGRSNQSPCRRRGFDWNGPEQRHRMKGMRAWYSPRRRHGAICSNRVRPAPATAQCATAHCLPHRPGCPTGLLQLDLTLLGAFPPRDPPRVDLQHHNAWRVHALLEPAVQLLVPVLSHQ